jgi:hypothetical protein
MVYSETPLDNLAVTSQGLMFHRATMIRMMSAIMLMDQGIIKSQMKTREEAQLEWGILAISIKSRVEAIDLYLEADPQASRKLRQIVSDLELIR